jgi:cysteine synthase
MARYETVLDTIGNTPMIKLQKLAPEGVNVYCKVESFNPMGSVKDRMAQAIIENAEQTGKLRPGQTVIESTSGNTGIGLAMVCAQKGYPLVITMSESSSVERRKLMRFLGARVVLTPASEKGSGMLKKAIELAELHGYYLCRQFDNDANPDMHSRTTAAEILADFTGEKIDYFVSGFGTGGTLLGISRRLKQADKTTKIIAVEPDNSQMLASGIAQARDPGGNLVASHPNFRPHLMQGWAPDFISTLMERAQSEQLIDEIAPVSGNEAMSLARQLAQKEGIFVGTSAGATLAGALIIAKRSAPGTNIVCMLPDTGERYLSTPLFDDINTDMNEEELALSRSTASCRFDVSSTTSKATVKAEPVTIDEEARKFVEETVANHSVVLFALEWCEFCWSARKLFNRLDIPFKSIDLDSVAFQKNDQGKKIREVLAHHTGAVTIPQIYIGGKHIGGCTELFDAVNDGSAEKLLRAAGLAPLSADGINPYEFLPKWLQPRSTTV